VEVVLANVQEKAEALQAVRELSGLFDRCVAAWLDDQANRYAEALNNCMILERTNRWAPLPESGVSSSAVDLFHMFHESVPQLFRVGLPITRSNTLSLVGKVDLFVMKYCNDLLTHQHSGRTYRLDPSTLIPKFTQRRDTVDKMTDKFEEYFTSEGRQAAKERKEVARPAKGQGPKELSTQEKMSAFFKGSAGTPMKIKDANSESASSLPEIREAVPDGAAAAGGEDKPDRMDHMEKRLEKIFGGKDTEPKSPVEMLPPKEERLIGLRTSELTVRMKNLEWCRIQSLSLEGDVCLLWDKERLRRGLISALPTPEESVIEAHNLLLLGEEEADIGDVMPLGPLLLNSQMAMQYGISTLVEYIGDKVVFFDLRELFVARLYYPSPSQCRLSSFLHQGGALDEALTEISAELLAHAEFADLLWQVLDHVCFNIVRVAEWCLAGPSMGAIERTLTPEDAQVVIEDAVAVRNYFTQRDEEGNSQGLDEEIVANKLAKLELLANQVLSQPTATLLQLHSDSKTPQDDDKEVATKTTILRVLERRPDKEAREYCRAKRKTTKKTTA